MNLNFYKATFEIIKRINDKKIYLVDFDCLDTNST